MITFLSISALTVLRYLIINSFSPCNDLPVNGLKLVKPRSLLSEPAPANADFFESLFLLAFVSVLAPTPLTSVAASVAPSYARTVVLTGLAKMLAGFITPLVLATTAEWF